MLAGAEQRRRYGKVHLVDQSGLEILPDRIHTAAEPDILVLRRVPRALQRRLDAVGDEVEGGAALHGERGARMVGEDEYVAVVGRVVAPPALPVVIRPRTPYRPEHVAAQDIGSDVIESACREVIVHAGRAALPSKHLPKCARGDKPLVHLFTADTERVGAVLAGTGAVAVERDGEGVDAKLRHVVLLRRSAEFGLRPSRLHLYRLRIATGCSMDRLIAEC